MAMNKNWGDRADKDLFFTILSVKNIGDISGSEWTTIGNHMRQLGYGFTNEGCRHVFLDCFVMVPTFASSRARRPSNGPAATLLVRLVRSLLDGLAFPVL